jgi:hypothetical protein
MIFRLTQKMAKKIKLSVTASCPIEANPYIDWTAHLFTAQRAQYVIVINTASLYSLVLHGRGITNSSRFVEYTLECMAEFMSADGFEFLSRRLVVPNAAKIEFTKLSDRSVIGSMNELVQLAKLYFIERQLSPFEASRLINEVPMSPLGFNNPKEAFGKLKLSLLEQKV